MSNEALLPPPPPPTYIFHEHKAEVNHVHLFDSDNYAASWYKQDLFLYTIIV